MKVFLKKHLFALLVVLTVMAAFAIGASAAGENRINFPTNASNVSIMSGNARVLEGQSAIIDSVTYVGLRSFCELFGEYSIKWNDATKTATVSADGLSLTATSGDLYIYANGRCLYTVAPIRIIDNKMCVPIRPIAKALGISIPGIP